MISLQQLALYLYYSICCVIAIWITIKQLDTYFENEDLISFKIKSFQHSTINNYPDFSFCVEATGGNQFNESRLPKNIGSLDVDNMFKGVEINKQNESQKNTAMQLLFNDLCKNDDITFEDLLNVDAKNLIKYYVMIRTNPTVGGNDHFWTSEGRTNFDKTFESNGFRCWTRKFEYTPGQLIKEEWITVSKETLAHFQDPRILLHQKNQNLRTTMNIPISDTLDIQPGAQKLPVFVITVQNIKQIFRRHNAKETCDLTLHNDNLKFMQEASTIIGCIPIFWKEFASSWIQAVNLTFCTKPEQYKKYYLEVSDWDVRYLVHKRYDPPCTKVLVTYDLSTKEEDKDDEDEDDDGELFIKILYRTEYYEEITNLRKFNAESMFSQIGGFIGIMLGVSLFHIPDILKDIISTGQAVYRKI